MAQLQSWARSLPRPRAPGHVAEVRRVVFDRLSPDEVEQLRALATTLLDGLTERSSVPDDGRVVGSPTPLRREAVTQEGQTPHMGVVVLLVLALVFGVGSVLEGLAWGVVIVVGLVLAAAVLGYRKLTSTSHT